jgi:hypothetical protein
MHGALRELAAQQTKGITLKAPCTVQDVMRADFDPRAGETIVTRRVR